MTIETFDHDLTDDALAELIDDRLTARSAVKRQSTTDKPDFQREAIEAASVSLIIGGGMRVEIKGRKGEVVKIGRNKLGLKPDVSPYDIVHDNDKPASCPITWRTCVDPIDGVERRVPSAPPLDQTFNSPIADVEAKLAGIFAAPDGEMARQFPEARDWQLRENSAGEAARLVCKVRDRRRKAAYKQSENGVEKKTGQKSRARHRNYHKPFVAIDFEGQDYPGDDREYLNTNYIKHRAFLMGAAGCKRLHDSVTLARVRHTDKARFDAMAKEFETLDFDWFGNEDKGPLRSGEIMHRLLSLPEKYGDVNFIMFVFSYDITQVLADVPRSIVWEICKRKVFDGSPKGGKSFGDAPVLWGPFAIAYLKSKVFKLWRLRDPDKPFKEIIDRAGKTKRVIDADRHITIYDAFGFYQERFAKVSESLVANGYRDKADHETIEAQKDSRPNFDNTPFDTIKHYCGLELIALSKALTVLRDGFDRMELRLNAWSGAGSAASALFKRENLNKAHFPKDIATREPLPKWQDAAHHAYFGGNIQLMKQGYARRKPLFGYDIVSAYPSACVELPSMRDGTWLRETRQLYFDGDFERVKATIASANVLSMFRVDWLLPEGPKPIYNRKTREYDVDKAFPFFPLPYRTKSGAILYPSAGETWIMRDELIAALQWIETFFPNEKARSYLAKVGHFIIEEQWLFKPGNDEKPFTFVAELFELRAATPKADILNKAIKLNLNAFYGKLAQSVGGGKSKAPPSACPYYAAAITANCRMRLVQAALLAPHDIVMFATDGIVSTKQLPGLERVVDLDAGEKGSLGDWEMKRHGGGFFLQSGVYILFAPKGDKADVKTRGFDVRNVLMTTTMREMLVEKVLPQWRKKFDQDNKPVIQIYQREYVTAGSACGSAERFKVMGRWAMRVRNIDIHNVGVKRDLAERDFAPLYCSRGKGEGASTLTAKQIELYARLIGEPIEAVTGAYEAGEAFRCRMLVPTLPAINLTPAKLSEPRMPDWVDTKFGEAGEDEQEQLDIALADA